MKELENLKELYLEEIKKINKKGELSPADGEAAKKALEAIQMIDDICCNEDPEYMESSGMYQRRMPDMRMHYNNSDYADRRGRSSMTGRYISRSDRSSVNSMIHRLEDMRYEAPNSDVESAINNVISRLESY